jgi:hypothetical protein
MWIGLPKTDTASIIRGFEHFCVRTRSLGRVNSLQYLRTDAAKYFVSLRFHNWARSQDIQLSAAAPHHQEQNSICERHWQNIQNLSRTLLFHARLPFSFYHFAIQYAIAILNVLPSKSVTDDNNNPSCPYFLAFTKRPKIGHFRVFGCPATIKRYHPYGASRSHSQRATRAIFIGFPNAQAGWLFYLPTPIHQHHFMVSHDATFDENFESATVYDSTPLPGDLPVRSFPTNHQTVDPDDPPTHNTGSVAELFHIPPPSTTPETTPNHHSAPVHHATREDPPPTHQSPSSSQASEDDFHSIHNDESFVDEHFDTPDSATLDHMSPPLTQPDFSTCPPSPPNPRLTTQEIYVATGKEEVYFDKTDQRMHSTYEHQLLKHPLHDKLRQAFPDGKWPVDLFLPEPQGLKAVLRLDGAVRRLWLEAIKKEIKSLIENGTFDINDKPHPTEQVIPTIFVFKAKQRADGYLDKLKARAVQRGDLQKSLPDEDTFSPCATSWGVRLFIAEATRRRRPPKILDFISAFLQGRAVGRYFVTLPKVLATFFPQYQQYFGVPLRLRMGMYGGTLSGKWWNQELEDWLVSENFTQSTLDRTYFIKFYPDGTYLRLIFHVDDMLYFGSNPNTEKDFELSIGKRFNVEINGRASWFLQMRIHNHADGGISIDQHRFVKNLLNRFCSNKSPYGIPKFRDTPGPTAYIYSKTNRPVNDLDNQIIQDKYPGLDFRSCLCTILYLAYSTRPDILFIVCKLAKACTNPGIKDFDALFWLLGYLRKRPHYAIKFYVNAADSPVNTLLHTNDIRGHREIIAFSDASWQDCPDTGRSTVGHLIFYQGGIIAANSHVPKPTAMPTAEAEYMGAAAAGMTAAAIRMLLYDMRYLGTKDYAYVEQVLQFSPTILCVDNSAAVAMAKSVKITKKSRHIARHFHYVREGEANGLHKVLWVSKNIQLADIMTKSQESRKIDPLFAVTVFELPKHLIEETTRGDHDPS